ncbi:MAG: TrmH family RNA methyltransferase [Bacteroidetes Order II. Incertae sedis bacterium]|nr:TrmH family RNA methyltransferase [Bacteroidetes Order II. bacterium]
MQKLPHNDIVRISPNNLSTTERHPIVLLLDNIRSAHNVGSSLRSADGALIEQVILSGYSPSPEHKSAMKTALGAQDFVPWTQSVDPAQTIRDYKKKGYIIAALEITDSPTQVDELSMSHFPLLLIAGNEVNGVSDEIMNLCDLSLEIPQYGAKQSLNVSVAVGIALFNLVERYRSFAQPNLV